MPVNGVSLLVYDRLNFTRDDLVVFCIKQLGYDKMFLLVLRIVLVEHPIRNPQSEIRNQKMDLAAWIVTIAGLAAMVWVVWYFWIYEEPVE